MKMPDNKNKGYTLVEIMIAITIGLILIAATTATYIVQNRSSVAQESVSEVNTQSKIAVDLISGEIRSAGFGAPEDMSEEPVNGITSIITPVDNTTTTDALTIAGGLRMIGTLWPAGSGPGIPCPATLDLESNLIRIVYSGTEAPNITDKRYLNLDGIRFVMVQNCTLDSGGNCTSGTITLDRAVANSFPLLDINGDGSCDTGRPVYLVEDTTYCVDNNAALRRIRRNGNAATCTALATSDNDVIAENIEDLQFTYAIDANNDGMADDQNGNNTLDFGDFLNGSAIADPSIIKAVHINILAKAERADISYTGMGNPPAVIENRNHAAVNDNFRRRWWQTVITMRNKRED
jgi:prepilin-type N-terminal cleavage/methylation domain-containing protein